MLNMSVYRLATKQQQQQNYNKDNQQCEKTQHCTRNSSGLWV